MRARLADWILLTGHRYSVASGVLVLMTGIVLVPGLAPFAIRNVTPFTYMASVLITGNVTLVTVVVAINQVVLSQELESPGSLRDEIERTAEYRRAALDRPPTSTEPADFLQRLLEQTRRRARSVDELLPESADEAGRSLRLDLPAHCERVVDRLESESDGLSGVIVPVLGADYAGYINECHRLRTRYEEDDYERLHATLDRLASDLENLDVARQYFTTAFMKRELATLSRSLLYICVPAVSIPIALIFQLTTYSGSSPPTPELFALAVLTAVFGLMPLALLIAFFLRIATVAKRIAVITPFEA